MTEKTSRWIVVVGVLVGAAAETAWGAPAGAVKIDAGQEFTYTGTVEWKSTLRQPPLVDRRSVTLSALVSRADVVRGYTVIRMRRSRGESAKGIHVAGPSAAVAILSYRPDFSPGMGADLASLELHGPMEAALRASRAPLPPRQGIRAGTSWRATEAPPNFSTRPIELLHTVTGVTRVANRRCLQIEKRSVQPLPIRERLGGITNELTHYWQTIWVDAATGHVVRDRIRVVTRQSAPGQAASVEVSGTITLQEVRRVSAAEVASRAKQVAELEGLGQRTRFIFPSDADREEKLAAARARIAAFRRAYPRSAYTPVLETYERALRARGQTGRKAGAAHR